MYNCVFVFKCGMYKREREREIDAKKGGKETVKTKSKKIKNAPIVVNNKIKNGYDYFCLQLFFF